MGYAIALTVMLAFPQLAHAQMIEAETWQGSDAAADTVFVVNPAAVLIDRKTRLEVVGMRKTTQVDVDIDSLEGDTEFKHTSVDQYLGVGLGVPLGDTLFVAGNYQQVKRRMETSHEPRAPESGMQESYDNQYLSLQFGFNLAKWMRIGALYRTYWIDANILGSYWRDERTKYDSRVTGHGLGLMFGTHNGGFSFTYVLPMRGKLDYEGESLLISEHGFYGLEWHFTAGRTQTGFGLRYYVQQKGADGEDWQDARNETVTAEDDRDVFLRGLYHEEPFLGGGLGFRWPGTGRWFYNFGGNARYSYAMIPFAGASLGDTWIVRTTLQASAGKDLGQMDLEGGAGLSKVLRDFAGDEGESAKFDSTGWQLFIKAIF